jgi:hypothetical protein
MGEAPFKHFNQEAKIDSMAAAELMVQKGRVILYIMPDTLYKESILSLMKGLTVSFRSVCFVTLNKPHYVLADEFTRAGIDTKRIFFIDAVSRKTEGGLKTLLISSPRALLELNTGIEEIIIGSGAECFVFDSLSTLLLYGDQMAVSRMVHFIAMRIRGERMSAVFTCLEKDTSSSLVGDISMFTDGTMRFGGSG